MPPAASLLETCFMEGQHSVGLEESSRMNESPAVTMNKQLSTKDFAMALHDDDDDSSVGSVTLLERDDFDEQTWLHVVTPTNIVAVVAGVGLFAIMSPLVAFSIIATTYGASHVLTHAHELLIEEYMLWKMACQSQNEEEARLMTSASKQKEQQKNQEQQQSGHADDATTPSLQDSSVVTKETTTTTTLHHSSLETVKSLDDTCDELSSTNLRPLEDEILVNQHFVGLNALEFFQVFFGDEAPFSFQEFQRKRGDVDICYGKWTRVNDVSTKFQCLERDISFRTLTKSYFGPPFVTCHKHQQVYLHKRLFIMDCLVRLEGIPFCDAFSVKERWVLEAPKTTAKIALLSVHSQVFFSKPCAFQQQIHSKSQSTLMEVVSSWCLMAQQALELTLAHKLERERNEQVNVGISDTDSIEVTHSYSSGKSTVLGDEQENEAPDYPPLIQVAASSPRSPRRQPLQQLKRSVLNRIVKKNVP